MYTYTLKRSRKHSANQAIIVAGFVISTLFSVLIPIYLAGSALLQP